MNDFLWFRIIWGFFFALNLRVLLKCHNQTKFTSSSLRRMLAPDFQEEIPDYHKPSPGFLLFFVAFFPILIIRSGRGQRGRPSLRPVWPPAVGGAEPVQLAGPQTGSERQMAKRVAAVWRRDRKPSAVGAEEDELRKKRHWRRSARLPQQHFHSGSCDCICCRCCRSTVVIGN